MAKHHIKICLGSSCFSRGNNVNVEVIKNFLRKRNLEADISFSGRLCEEMCNKGPVIVVDDRVYEEVSQTRLHKILEEEFKC
jgi:NADH:ubiquinone oxidoreductase subunit E